MPELISGDKDIGNNTKAMKVNYYWRFRMGPPVMSSAEIPARFLMFHKAMDALIQQQIPMVFAKVLLVL
jgi:hypothetical protein